MTLLKFTAACGFALLSTAAYADDLVPYSEAGGWDVQVDTTLGNGCLLSSDFEDGSHVRIGFDRTAGNGYVAAFNTAWGEIEDGTDYPISFMLDDEKYDGTGKGMHLDEVPGVLVSFDSPDFLTDLSAKEVMVLQSQGTEVMSIDLSGSDEAVTETVACQEEQEKG
ncbi:MAG: hypothetical protein JWS10_1904 [Cypionkella sp.]|uniref:hypothetical protein n=1 Tax=Cypionkella sp. TaxID=2811411 RepID=UPI0026190EAD|nr:hypothetical protein [Cypionkella sp.]MDB5659289.1 hypothetical protein [Cypionkella sp.]MDB5663588.1 hypothetical protein [Cypionkella sp.]